MPASSSQDVINAWNAVCGTFGFSSFPTSPSTTTMGACYGGSHYSIDCLAFMKAIGGQVLAVIFPDPPEDELTSAVLNDPAWYASSP